MSEAKKRALRVDFDRQLKLAFHGAEITSVTSQDIPGRSVLEIAIATCISRQKEVASNRLWMRSIAFALSFFSLACGDGPRVMNEHRFTRDMAERIELRGIARVEVSGPLELRLAYVDGAEYTFYLYNAYKIYSRDTDDKGAAIEDILLKLEAGLAEAENIDLDSIVPVLKGSLWLEGDAEFSPKEHLAYSEIAEGLFLVFAYDTENRLQYLFRDDIDALETAHLNLMERATSNLLRKLGSTQAMGGNGFFAVTSGDSVFDSSLPLLEFIWEWENLVVDGDFLFCVPARDTFLVTGTGNADHVRHMQDRARLVFEESPYPVSPHLYVYKDGSIEKYSE